MQTAEYEQLKTTTKYNKSDGPCLNALYKVLKTKNVYRQAYYGQNFSKTYRKSSQQNVKKLYNFNLKPLEGESRVTVFHYVGQEDGGRRLPHQSKNDQIPLSESSPTKCLFLLENTLTHSLYYCMKWE